MGSGTALEPSFACQLNESESVILTHPAGNEIRKLGQLPRVTIAGAPAFLNSAFFNKIGCGRSERR